MDAINHRVQGSQIQMKKLSRAIASLQSNISVAKSRKFTDQSGVASVSRFFRQVLRFMMQSHRLLEYCSAANSFRRRDKIAYNDLHRLNYILSMMDREIHKHPTQCNLGHLNKLYGDGKGVANLIMAKYSRVIFSK